MAGRETKKKIEAAFSTLLQQSAFSAIRVSDITALAGVSHMTFYRHYEDKFALLEEMCFDYFNRFVGIFGKNARWKEIVLCILNSIKSNPQFFRKVLYEDTSAASAINALIRISREYTENVGPKATYAAWQFTLQDWGRTNFKDSVDEVYWKLVTSMPICEVLEGEDLKRAVRLYEGRPMSYYRNK